MRTAMIAALSCALLSGSLSGQNAYSVQCEAGQAHVALKYIGLTTNGQSEHYRAEFGGKPSMAFADIPDGQGSSTMAMYLVTNLKKSLLLPYYSKVVEHNCLEFAPSSINEDPITMSAPDLSLDRKRPAICYTRDNEVMGTITFDVKTTDRHDPGKPMLTSLRVYVQGKDKAGKEFTLFDTRNPCKS